MHKFRRLLEKTSKDVTGHVKFLILLSSLTGAGYRNHTFEYSTTTCLRNVSVSGALRAVAGFASIYAKTGTAVHRRA